MENFQEHYQKDQTQLFQPKNSRNCQQELQPIKLMNWVKKCKLLAIKAIQYNSWPFIELDDFWKALYLSFNAILNCQIDTNLLEEIPSKPTIRQKLFSEEKFISSVAKYNNLSTPGLDKLSWRHLKRIIKEAVYLRKFINIADICINLGHWSLNFKVPTYTVIPKSTKELYDFSKAFKPIVCQDCQRWTSFISIFSLYLIFLLFYFLFSIFRTTWVRVDQSRCHISHKLMA